MQRYITGLGLQDRCVGVASQRPRQR